MMEFDKKLTLALTPALRNKYQVLWNSAIVSVKATQAGGLTNRVAAIRANKPRYDKVQAKTGCPWFVVGCIHSLEADLSFTRHLCNGDPLTGRTIHVPVGRIPGIAPPYTWEQSADDVMGVRGTASIKTWDVPQVLYFLEAYNGFGYANLSHPINTPYLWSYTNLYTKGKFCSDGHYDPDLVSVQIGAVALMKELRCL